MEIGIGAHLGPDGWEGRSPPGGKAQRLLNTTPAHLHAFLKVMLRF